MLKALGFWLKVHPLSSHRFQVEPGLKALGFNQLKAHHFQSYGFQLSTCTPYTTAEFFRLVEELGPVKHIVVPTYALEHKV